MSPILDSIGSVKGYGFTSIGESYWMGIFEGVPNSQINGLHASATDVVASGYVLESSNHNGFLMKILSDGIVSWQRSYSKPANGQDMLEEVVRDSSNNIYAVGRVQMGGVDGQEPLLIKVNDSGTLQFGQQLYDARNISNYGYGLGLDSSGNIFVAGTIYSAPTTPDGDDLFIAKYNSSGVVQWQKRLYGSAGSTEIGRQVATDSSGNAYIVGHGASSPLIAKYNTSGTLQFQTEYNTNGYFYGIAIDSSNNIYTVGRVASTYDEMLIVKWNTSGTIVWQRKYVISGTNISAYNVALDSAGNVYVSGTSTNEGSQGNNMYIIKYDSSGNLQFARKLRTSDNNNTEEAWAISVSPTGAMYFGGGVNTSTDGTKMFIAKLPSDGSKTGTYTVGTKTIIYEAGAGSSTTPTVSAAGTSLNDVNTTYSDDAASLTVTNRSYTMGKTSV